MLLLRWLIYCACASTAQHVCLQFVPTTVTCDKKRKLSDNLADMFPQLLNEQEKRVV